MSGLLAVCTVFCIGFGITACQQGNGEDDVITVTDMEGNQVTVPKTVSKVACISPSTPFFPSAHIKQKHP